MYSTSSQALQDLTRLFWEGYDHGVVGLPRRNSIHAAHQLQLYEQGYEQGLEVYKDTRVVRDYTTYTPSAQPREVINQVLALRNRIDQHHKDIKDLESKIRRLESGA